MSEDASAHDYQQQLWKSSVLGHLTRQRTPSPLCLLSNTFMHEKLMRQATPLSIALTGVPDTQQIPLKLTLAPSEVVAVTAPPPVYVRELPGVPSAAHHADMALRQCTS